MGWSETHRHRWTVWDDVQMMVESEVEGRDDVIAEVPFCAWMCDCGAWKWKLAPEVIESMGAVEI
jgi:hypothetical protein